MANQATFARQHQQRGLQLQGNGQVPHMWHLPWQLHCMGQGQAVVLQRRWRKQRQWQQGEGHQQMEGQDGPGGQHLPRQGPRPHSGSSARRHAPRNLRDPGRELPTHRAAAMRLAAHLTILATLFMISSSGRGAGHQHTRLHETHGSNISSSRSSGLPLWELAWPMAAAQLPVQLPQ